MSPEGKYSMGAGDHVYILAQFEMIRLWSKLTSAIKARDMDKATEEKTLVEDNQRQIAREREERGETWHPRFFDEVNEDYKFKGLSGYVMTGMGDRFGIELLAAARLDHQNPAKSKEHLLRYITTKYEGSGSSPPAADS